MGGLSLAEALLLCELLANVDSAGLSQLARNSASRFAGAGLAQRRRPYAA